MANFSGRVGTGFDAHRFAKEGGEPVRIVLGGVEFESPRAIESHSDGDVACHAIADALLGAAGLGDIGRHFPDSDPALAGVSSLVILEKVASMLAGAGFAVANVDVTVIAAEPRIAGNAAEMEARIAGALGVEEALVSVKATTTDGLGFTGRGEGIAAMAAAMLFQAP